MSFFFLVGVWVCGRLVELRVVNLNFKKLLVILEISLYFRKDILNKKRKKKFP